METTLNDEIEKLKFEFENVKSELLAKQEEINSLNADMEIKNDIIQKLSEQVTNLNTSFLVESIDGNRMKSECVKPSFEIKEIKNDVDIRVNKVASIPSETDLSKFPFISEFTGNDNISKVKEIDMLNQRISKITSEVIQLQNDLANIQENIVDNSVEVSTTETDHEDLVSELNARKSAINWLNSELEKKHSELKEKDNQISKKNIEIEDIKNHLVELEANLADKNLAIEKLQDDINNTNGSQNANSSDTIKEKQQEIDSLTETITTKNEIISQMSKELIDKQDVIFEKMKVAGNLQKQLDDSEHELIRRMNIISQLRKEVDQDKENIQTVSTSLHNKDMLIKQLQEQLNQVNQINVQNDSETKLSGEITWNKNIENVCNEIDENIKTKKLTDKEIE